MNSRRRLRGDGKPRSPARKVLPKAVARLVIGLVAGFLLVSMGAQIVAAPLTVPALIWSIASSRGRAVRVTLSVILVLTMLFVGWFVAYLLVREAQPWIVLAPVAIAGATMALCLWLSIRYPIVKEGSDAAVV